MIGIPPEKRYYTISEVSSLFKINPSNIRYWEKMFNHFLNPPKNSKGNRRYTKKDIQKIKLIYTLLKEKGFTIEGAKNYLKDQHKDGLRKVQTIEKLERLKAKLLEIKRQINSQDDH